MKVYFMEWGKGDTPGNFLAFPKTVRIDSGRTRFAVGIALPVRWFWISAFNNCLWFFRTYDIGFQFRVLVMQVGLLRERDRNGDAW